MNHAFASLAFATTLLALASTAGSPGGCNPQDVAGGDASPAATDGAADVNASSPDASVSTTVDGCTPQDVTGGDASPVALDGGVDATESSPDASTGTTVDAGGCSPIVNPQLANGSPATGTIVGTTMSAVLCPGGAMARIESAGASYDTSPFFLMLNYTVEETTLAQSYADAGGDADTVVVVTNQPASPTSADFYFQSPAGANNGELIAMLGLPSAGTGAYSSPGGQECGSISFTYYLPVPSWVNCDAGAPAPGSGCPAGCGQICDNFIGGGCSPCAPQPPAVTFTAQGSSDCLGAAGTAQTSVGSWQVSLSSVAPEDAGAASQQSYYAPHGAVTATMVADDGSKDTITLALSF